MNYKLREIREADLEMIMNWRMKPEITRYMNTDPKLTMETQKKWFSSLKDNKTVRYWLFLTDDVPAGVINLSDLDLERKTTSWAYYIAEKKSRSIETAISLEMSLYDYVFDVLGLEEIHNEIFSLNKGVIKLHQLCGCRKIKEVKEAVEKNGIKYDITYLSLSRQEWLEYRKGKDYVKISFDI